MIPPAPDLAGRRRAFPHELHDFDYAGRIARDQFVAREVKARQHLLDSQTR
ncbi:hypothetical protein [Mycobacterium arosiense]|uniref:hypothetical protein n=1 Tax=Mycobacterium arosiense TaxID=425468 RepID=UPI0014749BC3